MTYAKRVDNNQAEIVKALRDVPGVSVKTGVDDILVGFKGKNFLYEIKSPEAVRKDGDLKSGALRDSQKKMKARWMGHYRVVWSVDQILGEIFQKGAEK